jgi:serine protease inhibitor
MSAFITEAEHIVKLDVDQDGIEGAAVTSFQFGFKSSPQTAACDRPFYFDIILKNEEKNTADDETIIFSGRIMNPSLN